MERFSRLSLAVILVLILCNCFWSLASAAEKHDQSHPTVVLYVSPDGNDAWSGLHAAPVASGKDGPFASLTKARDAIRELKRRGSKAAFTVLVRGGTYRLRDTLVFGPQDTGTASTPTIFKAYGSERPVISGAVTVKDLKRHSGNIYSASLAETGLSTTIRQLFIDGERQTPARYPNFDASNPHGGGFLLVTGRGKEGGKRSFRFDGSAVRSWQNIQDAEVFIYPGPNYTSNTLKIAQIDRSTGTIELLQDASYPITVGNRFYLQNVFEELDAPGEWYFNRQSGRLFIWAPSGRPAGQIEVPVIETLIAFRARLFRGKPVGMPEHIRFEGFTFQYSNGTAILISGAHNIAVVKSVVRNTGGHGIEISDGVLNRVVGNDIFDVGYDGIRISGGDRETFSPGRNLAENNHIHHVGKLVKTGSGIEVRGVGNTVAHNLVHDTPRVGIWFEGNDHVIEFNHVHHVNQDTQDSGIIYAGQIDWTKRGTVVRHNYLHHSGGIGWDAAKKVWRSPYETYGIYLDDWTSGTHVYGNIIAHTQTGAVMIHGGRDNQVENNIIIEGGRLGQIVFSAWPPSDPTAQRWLPKMYAKVKAESSARYPLLATITDLQTGSAMAGNKLLRNIIVFSGGESILFGIYKGIDLASTVSDFNFIHHGGPLLVPFTKKPAAQQWLAWQKMGFDRNSVQADPRFVNEAVRDYRLSPDSPALKLGFRQIPVEKIGPYQDAMRASWPLKENH